MRPAPAPPPPMPGARAPRGEAPEPRVEVRIGAVEIRAPPAPERPPERAPPAAEGFDDYQRVRASGSWEEGA